MYPLVQQTGFGTLEIHKVYEEYDGPKLFSAVNALGLYFLVYWIDELEDSDVWLYIPMSERRLLNIESGERTLRDAFLYPEENSIFRVTTKFDGSKNDIKLVTAEQIVEDELPPIDYRIQEIAEEAFEDKNQIISHEVHIARPSRRGALNLNSISKVLDAWSSIYDELLRTVDAKAVDQLIPVDARPGSFTLRVASKRYEETSPAIEDFFDILANSEDIHLTLLGRGIDIEVVKDFLALMVDSAYDFKITPLADIGSQHFLSKSQAEMILNKLNESELTYLSSLRVPQADDLYRVFAVIEAKANGFDVNEHTLGITPRQVAYYKHAARTLGYLNSMNQPTSAAMQFNMLTQEQKLQSAAMRFQSSDCGWTWISWSGGRTLLDIEDGSGLAFLLACVPSLNENTAQRRSKTLNSWLKIFKEVLA